MYLFFRTDKRREVPLIPDLTFRPPLLEPIMICFVLLYSLIPLTPLTQLNRKQNCKYQQISLTITWRAAELIQILLIKLFVFLEFLIVLWEIFGLLLRTEHKYMDSRFCLNIILLHHLIPDLCFQKMLLVLGCKNDSALNQVCFI